MRAERDGDRLRLNGTKRHVEFAGAADRLVVLDVHTDERVRDAIHTVRRSRHSERVRAYSDAVRAVLEALPLADCDDIINIPLDKLRDRLDELDPSLPTIVACRSGLRSYVATRILKQHGFQEVYNLSGATAMREFALNRRLPAAYTTTASGVPRPDALIVE